MPEFLLVMLMYRSAVFTDAVNGTGLAGISYHNGTLFQVRPTKVCRDETNQKL